MKNRHDAQQAHSEVEKFSLARQTKFSAEAERQRLKNFRAQVGINHREVEIVRDEKQVDALKNRHDTQQTHSEVEKIFPAFGKETNRQESHQREQPINFQAITLQQKRRPMNLKHRNQNRREDEREHESD